MGLPFFPKKVGILMKGNLYLIEGNKPVSNFLKFLNFSKATFSINFYSKIFKMELAGFFNYFQK